MADQTLIAKVGSCYRVHRLGARAYKFFFNDDDRDPVYILWDAGNTTAPADVSGPVTITDLSGSETEMAAEDLTLTPVPIFVEKR